MMMERKVQKYIWRAVLSVFVASILFMEAPMQAYAYVFEQVEIKSSVFNGTYSSSSVTLSITPDGVVPIGQIAYYNHGNYYEIDFPVFKAVDLSQFSSYQSTHDTFFFLVFGSVNPRLSITTPPSPSYVRSYGMQAEIVFVQAGIEYVYPVGTNIYARFPVSDFPSSIHMFVRLKFFLEVYLTTGTNASSIPHCSMTISPQITINNSNFYGQKIVTTGDKQIVDAINSLSAWLNTAFNSLYTKISAESSAIQNKIQAQINNDNANTIKITDKIQAQINNDNSNTTKQINAINSASQNEINAANKNSQNEINAANKNSENEIAAANKNADDIMHDYDTTSQDSDNKKFDDAQKELQEVEDNLFGQAVSGFSDLNMSDYTIGKFSAVLGAFSFVSNFIQSLYVKMDDFGTIVTIGLVVMIATKVIGVYRFSTGGDSS